MLCVWARKWAPKGIDGLPITPAFLLHLLMNGLVLVGVQVPLGLTITISLPAVSDSTLFSPLHLVLEIAVVVARPRFPPQSCPCPTISDITSTTVTHHRSCMSSYPFYIYSQY